MRLNLAQLLGADETKSGQPIRLAATAQLFQPREFLLVSRYNNFAADFIRKIVRAAKFDHLPRTLDTQLRLQRSWFVINARMNHSAIVVALVLADASFFLK